MWNLRFAHEIFYCITLVQPSNDKYPDHSDSLTDYLHRYLLPSSLCVPYFSSWTWDGCGKNRHNCTCVKCPLWGTVNPHQHGNYNKHQGHWCSKTKAQSSERSGGTPALFICHFWPTAPMTSLIPLSAAFNWPFSLMNVRMGGFSFFSACASCEKMFRRAKTKKKGSYGFRCCGGTPGRRKRNQ